MGGGVRIIYNLCESAHRRSEYVIQILLSKKIYLTMLLLYTYYVHIKPKCNSKTVENKRWGHFPFLFLILVPVNTTSVICPEGTTQNLTCAFGQMKVFSAFYGRMSYNTCKFYPMRTANCFMNVLAKIAPM
jgi:hypothetical protein